MFIPEKNIYPLQNIVLLKLSSIPNSELLVVSSLSRILLAPHLGPPKTKICSACFFPLFYLSLQVPFSFHVLSCPSPLITHFFSSLTLEALLTKFNKV